MKNMTHYKRDDIKNLLEEIGVKKVDNILKKLRLSDKKTSSKELLPLLSKEEIDILNNLLKEKDEPLLDYDNILINIMED